MGFCIYLVDLPTLFLNHPQMRQFYPLLLSVLTFPFGIFAQKNTVALDLRYLPVCGEIVAGGAVNYYRSTTERHALGLKTNWNTDALGVEDREDIRTHVVNLDIVNRWQLSKKSKVRCFVEAGISGLGIIERTPPQTGGGFCGTGMTAEDLIRQEEYFSRWHTDAEFLLGFATATNIEWMLTKRLGLGAVLMANLYLSVEDESFYPYINPGVRTSFSF